MPDDREDRQLHPLSNAPKIFALTLGAIWCFINAYGFARKGLEFCKEIKRQIDEEIYGLRIKGEP